MIYTKVLPRRWGKVDPLHCDKFFYPHFVMGELLCEIMGCGRQPARCVGVYGYAIYRDRDFHPTIIMFPGTRYKK